MQENQNVEWKVAWKDEYLRWICGFANAQGGRIYIGKDDNGRIVGISNYKKLMEDIPNKVQNSMGILVDVNLLSCDKNLHYIEINVAPSSFPVNYKGEYHYRCGSTKQQLQGAALTDFLLSKIGMRWDNAPCDSLTADALDTESFDIFRREAIRNGRMSAADLEISNLTLLDYLNLTVHQKLKRAAVVLFYRHPERLFSGCFVKIGKFANETDLLYQDEVTGSLFIMADRVLDLIYLKYLKANITYKHDRRIETYPYPREAVREIVYNALIHSNWADGTPIQIRIDEESLSVTNSCILPMGWTKETLLQRHKSKPYNPDIALVFFRAGFVESWGRGIQKIQQACRNAGIKEPVYQIIGNDLTVTLCAPDSKTSSKTSRDVLKDAIDDRIMDLIQTNPHITQTDLAIALTISVPTVQRRMKELIAKGQISRMGGKRLGYWQINNL